MRLRNNRLFVWLSAMAFFMSFVGLWLGNAVLFHLHEGPDYLLHHHMNSLQSTLSWNPILQEIQNRTIAARRGCNETMKTTTAHHFRLRGHDDEKFPPNDDISRHCNFPPQTECQTTSYSILVLTEATNLRILFLNLLQYLTLPNVSRIHVVLMGKRSSQQVMQQDIKYGHRILHWNQDTSHKVKLGLPLDAMMNAGAVLVVDDDDSSFVPANHRGLEFGLELWKRHSNSLVAARTYSLKKKSLSLSHVIKQQQHSNMEPTYPFVPVCQDESLEAAVLTTDTTLSSNSTLLQLVDLSGLWMHSNFLCLLLQSPMLKSLIPTNPNAFKLTAGVWLMQIAQPPLHMYRSRLPAIDDIHKTLLKDSWIDNALLTGLVHDFGGMPMSQSMEWCESPVGGAPKPCDGTKSATPDPCISQII